MSTSSWIFTDFPSKTLFFRFFVNYTECDPAITVSVGLDFIKNKQVDAIIGPACPDSKFQMITVINKFA